MAKARTLSSSTKREADALLDALKMAERHKRWPLFQELLGYLKSAGARFVYLGPGTYALSLTEKEPK